MMLSTGTPIRLMIVDDHPIVRTGLAAVIATEHDMRLVCEASNGRQAMEMFRRHTPDVTLMDLRLLGMSGVETIAALREEFPASRFLVLTTYDTDEDIYRAFEAGARGYLLKGMFDDEFAEAIRVVHRGLRYVPPAVEQRLAERLPGSDLTAREREVLELVVRGLSNKEIAQSLVIAESTVRWFLTIVFGKLGVRDRTQAATAALRRGLVRL